MESIDSLDNQPSISCGFVETMQLSVSHGRYGRPYGITYTEEVAGSSPVPPTMNPPPPGDLFNQWVEMGAFQEHRVQLEEDFPCNLSGWYKESRGLAGFGNGVPEFRRCRPQSCDRQQS